MFTCRTFFARPLTKKTLPFGDVSVRVLSQKKTLPFGDVSFLGARTDSNRRHSEPQSDALTN